MPMNDNEIERLKREIERLQGLLKAQSIPAELTDLRENFDFISDLARFAESIYTEAAVRKKWRLDDATWSRLAEDEDFIEKVEATKTTRIRNGSSAREKAQQLFTETPAVLGEILRDDNASPRHRIEASREIRAVAGTGPETTPASDRFVIQINLGEDYKLRFDKSITPVSNDKDVEIIDSTLLPMIAANKQEGNDGGEPL